MIFNSSMTFLKTTRFFAYSIVIGANLMSFAFNNRVGSKQTKKKLLSILQNGRIHAPDQFFFQNGRMPNCRESCPPFFIINQEDMIPLINKLGVLTYWLASSCTGLLIPFLAPLLVFGLTLRQKQHLVFLILLPHRFDLHFLQWSVAHSHSEKTGRLWEEESGSSRARGDRLSC